VEDDRPDAAPVAIVTHDFWQRLLGADTGVLQRSLVFDGRTYKIIGVMPRGFKAPSEFAAAGRPEFFVPAAFPADLLANHGDHEVNVLGRLTPGGISMRRTLSASGCGSAAGPGWKSWV
jgi:hypothetical protein